MDTSGNMREFLNLILEEIREDTDTLSASDGVNAELAARIRTRLFALENIIDVVFENYRICRESLGEPVEEKPERAEPDTSAGFTPQSLQLYNGQNGNPAYVAVNGVVYDVSNVRAWSGASHYSLTPGRDLTPEYRLCHNMREILYKLPTVGVMVFSG